MSTSAIIMMIIGWCRSVGRFRSILRHRIQKQQKRKAVA